MFTLSTTFTESDQAQALRLSRAYYVDLINKYVKPHGPTSSLCIAQVETEVQAYLDDARTGCYQVRAGAVFARDEATGEVIGFATYLGGKTPPTDCGLNYVVVDKRHRRQGIMKAMLGVIMEKFTFIGLSCNVDKVPYYEALGFRVTGSDMMQVGMSWGVDKPHGVMNVLGFDNSEPIQTAIAAFKRNSGGRAEAILAELGRVQEQKISEVEAYVRKRQSGLSHADAI
ncbi:GNAT family N-acetyltransferase [Pseudomonas sp. Irchel 3E13]|uniref:GNAT family N-acetyltransferase n=1 Tax=Pseudomonas sp. Irchel 3E13 TaxID=2008975 RepID=UPI000BA2D69E|nr:GNAT family N-acetyltransferase [Pseudomonas sp. Irchel 3E13]